MEKHHWMFSLQANHLQHLYLILCNDVDCKEAIYNKKKTELTISR
jgi:hypothetical protein